MHLCPQYVCIHGTSFLFKAFVDIFFMCVWDVWNKMVRRSLTLIHCSALHPWVHSDFPQIQEHDVLQICLILFIQIPCWPCKEQECFSRPLLLSLIANPLHKHIFTTFTNFRFYQIVAVVFLSVTLLYKFKVFILPCGKLWVQHLYLLIWHSFMYSGDTTRTLYIILWAIFCVMVSCLLFSGLQLLPHSVVYYNMFRYF
jgi:hypothetical protein